MSRLNLERTQAALSASEKVARQQATALANLQVWILTYWPLGSRRIAGMDPAVLHVWIPPHCRYGSRRIAVMEPALLQALLAEMHAHAAAESEVEQLRVGGRLLWRELQAMESILPSWELGQQACAVP